jgi:hypothetical protein
MEKQCAYLSDKFLSYELYDPLHSEMGDSGEVKEE